MTNSDRLIAQDFLIELGCEELPPKSLLVLSEAFKALLGKQLTQQHISYQDIKPFATPRRLALLISQLAPQQPDQILQKRGPALTAAFNAAGEPTAAALGFAKSCGVSMDALGTLKTDKGSWLVYDCHQTGKSSLSLLPTLISNTLNQLPIAKRMRWGTRTESFIRPVKWLLALYGDDVVDMTLLGCRSDRLTYGHRVHAPQPITIPHPQAYESLLEQKGWVMADFQKRRSFILEQLREQAEKQQSELSELAAINDLLDEVTALVEQPCILFGTFEPRFLNVPKEALIQTMQDNQKYFALFDRDQQLKPQFLFVSNLRSDDPREIIQGNEKVIRPRFSDAEFFFEQDQRQPLEKLNEPLKTLVFQNKLGSVFDKVLRISKLSQFIAGPHNIDFTLADVQRATLLCKADLATQMVQEMPALQGKMGGYYAKIGGEKDIVCQAISQHYQPTSVDDVIPIHRLAQTIALADKLDTLVSIFAVGLIPSGDKDPFALRRAALGCIRIICEGTGWTNLSLRDALKQAANEVHSLLPTVQVNELTEQVWLFIRGRLESYMKHFHNIDTRIFHSVYALAANSSIYDLYQRIFYLRLLYQHPDLQALSSANKRVNNLLKKNQLNDLPLTPNNSVVQHSITLLDNIVFEFEPTQNLYQAVIDLQTELNEALEYKNYQLAIQLLSQLRKPVDLFFEKVHIMTDDQELQKKHLALLTLLQTEFLKIADLSYLVIDSEPS